MIYQYNNRPHAEYNSTGIAMTDTRNVSLIVTLAQPVSLHYISFITFNAVPVTLLSSRVIACFARA